MRFLRLLLFPVSLIYGLVVVLRNLAYDAGIFKSKRYDLPVICIGNLAVGGAGKSPMAEYLITLLKEQHKLATLSRGYGRKSRGFLEVKTTSTSDEAGDEPLQFKQKFPDVTVTVCEKRVEGINRLTNNHDLVIMDDAFQHRAVKAGLNILLFDYNTLFKTQLLLPAGDLREPMKGRKRAQVLMITKTPAELSAALRDKLLKRIKPYPGQPVYFSYLDYGNLQALNNPLAMRPLSSIGPGSQIILLTGIARAQPLLEKIRQLSPQVEHHEYPDHHRFSKKNIIKLAEAYRNLSSPDKLVITTEKDAKRLQDPALSELLTGIDVYYLPVQAKIHQPGAENFNDYIKKYVTEHSVNHRIHQT